MRRFQWGIRDLFWLVICAALVGGWWVEFKRHQTEIQDLRIRAARAEELLSALGYTATPEKTVYTTTSSYWPARQAAERAIQKLLSGKNDDAATLPFVPGSLGEFQFGDVVQGQVDPCRPDRAEFTISLSGKTRNASMMLFLNRNAVGEWQACGASAVQ